MYNFDGHEGTQLSESQPLLMSLSQRPEDATRKPSTARHRQWHVYLLFMIVAGLDTTIFMLNLPLARVYESIICYYYFAAREPSRFTSPFHIPEALCKAKPVQEDLALVKGYELLFMVLPGLFLAILYGKLADHWGRRTVLRICVLGLALAVTSVLLVCWFWWLVPLQMVWFAWSLTTIGGGAAVLLSTVFTMLADLIEPDQRAAIFLQLSVAIFGAQAISTPIATYTMNRFGALFPVAAGYFLGLLSCSLTLLVPETRPQGCDTAPGANCASLNINVGSDPESSSSQKKSWCNRVVSATKAHLTSLKFISKSPNLMALLTVVLTDSFNASVPNLIVQYTSTKFAAPISETGLLITIKAVIVMIVFLILFPLMGQRLLQDRLHFDARERDLWLARLTMTCGPIGFLVIAIAPNFAVAGNRYRNYMEL
ncbi:hypothetical protein HIM_11748 [Hirsutella minnesotensis 3608]|uniref:Major facilitator superfamily (MFS) profile domain-containing protein n=1 Tax=Hirsutella minnesotensis 3608 TaxID=1043627 RepID=A0A0F7ZWF2_9HYPO|nr:hypothetical protein HIM_11748 [Hirsutella minnesotensis 3608]